MVWKQVWILKATLSSFIFCCCFSALHPLPVFVSFFLHVSLSFNLIFPLFHIIPLHQALSYIFKAFHRKPLVVLKSNCSARMGHGSVARRWPTCQEREPRMLWPLVNWPCHHVPQVWLHAWRKKTPINLCYWITLVQWFSTLAAQRSPQELLKEYWCQSLDSELIVWDGVQTSQSISLFRLF